MNLADLFRGHRRSEPMTLLVLKLLIMIILISCLTGYLAIVMIDVIQDAPITRTSFVNFKNIRPPTNCLEEYYKINDTQPTMEDCMSDITHPDEKYGPSQLYFGTYQPSPGVLFYDYKKSNDYSAMMSLGIVLVINDDSYTPDKATQAMIETIAFDSDYDPLIKYIEEKRYYELTTPEAIESTSDFDNSIVTMNSYVLVLNQLYQFVYRRKIEEFITPSWTNDFGIPPAYDNKSHIESTLLATSLPINNVVSKNMVMISIHPMGSTVQIDKEVRSHTVSGMGLMGGAWGLAAAIYALLFGADTLRPWGVVQLYCCGFSRLTQGKLKKTLPIIPFFDASHIGTEDHPPNHDLSLAEKNELRIKSLELFLQEYVVDVHYLDGIRDKLSRSKATFTSTSETINNLNSQVIQDMRIDNLNTSSMYTPISNTNNISDTHNNFYDNNPRQT
ncbi:hypothetical protein RclHR1_05970012 [Rhizophagus clarus]|uniref:Uncharacterized protein n=1 Tax=Rhizophagus clarus TaxID=94130 RepID=A0A2Z6S289_9GLOM|nr:hypothetical protein RclHR1_05970012 [Rhizophagus clarus]